VKRAEPVADQKVYNFGQLNNGGALDFPATPFGIL
jgi:hypothetical protein